MDLVPGSGHYRLEYLLDGRLYSYAHQLDAALRLSPSSVLEVGVGSGMIAAALRAIGVSVTTLDVQPELKPDVVGSVLAIPRDNGAFDVAICGQVLEHLPFDDFIPALRELRRVTVRGVVLSLPDRSPHHVCKLRLPGRLRLDRTFSFQWRRPPTFSPVTTARNGHFWEIGYEGFELSRVQAAIQEAGWRIARSWRVPEKYWHRFFQLGSA
jgi:SAM-dependent methyltransferase